MTDGVRFRGLRLVVRVQSYVRFQLFIHLVACLLGFAWLTLQRVQLTQTHSLNHRCIFPAAERKPESESNYQINLSFSSQVMSAVTSAAAKLSAFRLLSSSLFLSSSSSLFLAASSSSSSSSFCPSSDIRPPHSVMASYLQRHTASSSSSHCRSDKKPHTLLLSFSFVLRHPHQTHFYRCCFRRHLSLVKRRCKTIPFFLHFFTCCQICS